MNLIGSSINKKLFVYKANKIKKGLICVICLSEIKNKKKVIQTPCGHFFDLLCVKGWLKAKKTCPVCRLDLLKKSKRELKLKSKPLERGTFKKLEGYSA